MSKHKNTTNVPMVPPQPMAGIHQSTITTKGGNTLSFFYNPENDLLVVDLVRKDQKGGNELVRMTLNEYNLLTLPV